MLNIDANGVVGLTRGDTARLKISILNEATQTPYEIAPDDTLTMSLKKNIEDKQPCVQKVIKGADMFHILPTDTSGLAFGNYFYDVQITTGTGDVYTVLGPATFKILKEVTN